MLKAMADTRIVTRAIFTKETGQEACLMGKVNKPIRTETLTRDRSCMERNSVKECTDLLTEKYTRAVFTTIKAMGWEKSHIQTKNATKVSGD